MKTPVPPRRRRQPPRPGRLGTARARVTRGVVGAVVSVVTAVLLAPVTANYTAGTASAAPLPSNDPFYTYAGPLESVDPGTVLRTRPIAFAAGDLRTPIVGTQALYRTTDQHGDPVTTVTTIFRPITPNVNSAIVSYHVAYDALGSQCDPSYTLQGNNPNRLGLIEQSVIAGYLAAGYTVSVPDYEGQQLEWTIGRQSGYAALDGVRATEAVLGMPATTPVGLVGYSGGSVPTDYGAEVAPTYAPELTIVAAAAGGLPVDLAHNLPYISGSTNWSGVIPALVTAYSRAYDLDTSTFLSAYGTDLVNRVQHQCIAEFVADYPGLTDSQMVTDPYTSLLQVPEVVSAINDNIMSSAGTPQTPLFLAVGHSDVTGDGVMVTDDVQGLAHTYCTRGVSVNFMRYNGLNHGDAYVPFQRDAAVFLHQHFVRAGEPDECSSIGPGNSLDPLPVPSR